MATENPNDMERQRLFVIWTFVTMALGWMPSHSWAQSETPVETSPADIGFLGLHGGIYEQLQTFAPELDLSLRYFEDSAIQRGEADFGSVKILYIQHTRAEDREQYKTLFQSAKERNPSLQIIAFQANTNELFASLGISPLLTQDEQAGAYYGSTKENLRRLLRYTGSKYLKKDWKIEPPVEIDRIGLYHPAHQDLFETAEEFLLWQRAKRNIHPDQPRLLIAVHGTHLAFQQPAVVDAIILEAEKQGAVAAALIDGRYREYEVLAKSFSPSVVIHTCHSTDSLAFRLQLDVPHLHSIFFRKQSIVEYQESVDGLAGSELAFHIIGQELIGAIEPQIGGGTRTGQGSAEAIQPIPERVEHLIARALAHARLRHSPPEDKRVAIVYYDRELGKGELMRGSSTGMHMNAPRSLINVLAKMRERGYRIAPAPSAEEELLGWMMERGRQIGVWAPSELERLVRKGSPALIPAEQYRQWYEAKIPSDRRLQMEEKWGPPPGKFMVWNDGKESYIVVPRIDLGNVVLLPQPLRGELHEGESVSSQTHDKVTAPPHNYMATYFWLEQEYQADAVVHFGTHGSEFALPGKPNGLVRRDWPDILMGRMPNFNPWIVENMVESSPVRRRVYGTLISHLPPPMVDADLSDELESLHELLDKWETLEEGALKEGFRKELTKLVRQTRLDTDLHLTQPDTNALTDEQLTAVAKYLHDIKEESIPTNLHVFGETPREDLLIPYLVQILRRPFLHELQHLLDGHGQDEGPNGPGHSHDHPDHQLRSTAERIVELVVRQKVEPRMAVGMVAGRPFESLPEAIEKGLRLAVELNEAFLKTGDEVENLLRGLDGRFVPPGPGNSPIRNPNVVPTGRNMVLLNPEEIPSRPSWELGVRLAKDMIANHTQHHGTMPTRIGFDLRSSATFRDYGVMEAQILYLLGVEPVWDDKRLVTDVRLISRETLGRPRVDVFIAAGGWYESNLPSRLQLWDKAIRLVTESNEPDNVIQQHAQSIASDLMQEGMNEERARILSRGRIFGIAPGRENGGMLSYRVARSGEWDTREDIADTYLATHKHIYTEGAWGEAAGEAYDKTIQGTHTVVRSWSDHLTGPLASRYTWLHGGSLCLAIERMTGRRPEYVFSDVRDPDRAGMIPAEDALRREYRTRLFNRKWLEGMMKEGYAGADHMRFLVSNSFGWEVTRPGSVGNDNWDEMKRVLVDDKLNLGLNDWFERNNPYAFQDAMATMLESSRKGYWRADELTLSDLANRYAANVAKHGLSGHLTSGGNEKLHTLVQGLIAQNAPELVETYQRKVAPSDVATQSPSPANEPLPEPAIDAAPPPLALPPESPDLLSADSTSSSQDASQDASLEDAESMVRGQQLSNVSDASPASDARNSYWWIGLVIAMVFLGGFALRQKI
ncbi:Aerobic cobaltochelatase subunit CobN [Pirellula sp. SH-Sr6A]|uniref:cobaltochelatase subunit CobN n=1 Tax=Pirellula sp. SH-Sr6A TaxID=1632865 RepID=UPI00078E4460|nr:cobaltochelatase subunit CobN [Pirellula sp. SH-Sr6A]AMV32952.1 Aerobic cobaltochelatase subunit CobN [Pirellula sp. SH-Sr6A]